MDAIEALKTRRAVRAYGSAPVPREIVEDIIDCGRLAATAINIQPWEFVVVTSPQMRRSIAHTTDYGKFIAEAPVCVVVLCQDTKYYLEDGSAATENIMLAARAHGLGSCWVAGDKKPYAADICRLLGAPPSFKLVSLIPMGYPAETPEKSKRPLADVLHWEKY
jgi:nitroreductase